MDAWHVHQAFISLLIMREVKVCCVLVAMARSWSLLELSTHCGKYSQRPTVGQVFRAFQLRPAFYA